MLKVLIAEDEILTRVGIVSAVDWPALELEVAAQAGDGLEALHLFRLHKPEIVITDLNMPGLSGSRLIENIYEESPECRVIVVTCINDVETIRSLMPYRIFDYLLKSTISPQELTERLTLAKKQILEAGALPDTEGTAQKAAPDLREFLEGSGSSYGVFPEEGGYALLLVTHAKAANTGLLAKALKDILKDYFRESGDLSIAVLQQRNFVLCFQDKVQESDILSTAVRFQEYVLKALNVRVLCNLEYCESAPKLRALCREYFALTACCNTADWSTGTGLTEEYRSRIDRLLSLYSFSIFAGEVTQSLTGCFGEPMKRLRQKDAISFEDYKRVVQDGLRELGAQYDLFSHTQIEEVCRKIALADSFELVYLHYFYFLDKQAEALIYPVSYSREIRCALDYIRQNCRKKISLQDVAEAAMLSPNYFSTVFKNSMDISFINYVIRYRMYAAMKLLRDKSLYLYDIAERVGIPEISHFSKSFKKVTGFSPNEWRKITAELSDTEW